MLPEEANSDDGCGRGAGVALIESSAQSGTVSDRGPAVNFNAR